MNVYFLVEGKTERKVYPKWLAHLAPQLKRVNFPCDATANNYYLISGGGFPSILDNHLKDLVSDINTSGNFDYLVLLEATSPLREPGNIDDAIEKLIDNEYRADSLIAMGKLGAHHPVLARMVNDDGYLRPFLSAPDKGNTRRQALPGAYIPYGIIYMSSVEVLRQNGTFYYQERTLPYVTKRWQDFTIDDEWDFLCVESILKKRSLQPSVC